MKRQADCSFGSEMRIGRSRLTITSRVMMRAVSLSATAIVVVTETISSAKRPASRAAAARCWQRAPPPAAGLLAGTHELSFCIGIEKLFSPDAPERTAGLFNQGYILAAAFKDEREIYVEASPEIVFVT